jgi:hypothetical protein
MQEVIFGEREELCNVLIAVASHFLIMRKEI